MPRYPVVQQIPIEGFKMADVKNDAMPLGDRTLVERIWFYDGEQFVGAPAGIGELFEKIGDGRRHRFAWLAGIEPPGVPLLPKRAADSDLAPTSLHQCRS